jgi:hypothetical protein
MDLDPLVKLIALINLFPNKIIFRLFLNSNRINFNV